MFEQFPYTNFHEINLDWILRTLKEKYGPDNPPQNVVLSVNGQTGDVVIFPDAIIRLPDVDDGTWNIHRLANGVSRGIQFTPTGAERIEGAQRYKMYDEGHPPEYPVTSVNGQTGNITISIPVQSVNGQTGAIVLYSDALVRWPDVQEGTWNLRRVANGVSRGIQFTPNGAERIEGANRYLFYDSSNLPALVNDREPQILELSVPTEYTRWGFERDVGNGSASIYLDTSGDTIKAYVSFTSLGGQTVTYPLLTNADIPASAGVVSINQKTGVVTIYGTDVYTTDSSNKTVTQALSEHDTTLINHTARINANAGSISAIENGLVVIVNGDTASSAVDPGQYVYIINNTHGLAEGLYQNTSENAFPVSGGTADNTVFTNVSSVINAINDKLKFEYVENLGQGVRGYKWGRLCFVSFENFTASSTYAQNATILTLPANFRPVYTVSFLDTLSVILNEQTKKMIAIRTNGTVFCPTAEVPANSNIRGCVTYISAE